MCEFTAHIYVHKCFILARHFGGTYSSNFHMLSVFFARQLNYCVDRREASNGFQRATKEQKRKCADIFIARIQSLIYFYDFIALSLHPPNRNREQSTLSPTAIGSGIRRQIIRFIFCLILTKREKTRAQKVIIRSRHFSFHFSCRCCLVRSHAFVISRCVACLSSVIHSQIHNCALSF